MIDEINEFKDRNGNANFTQKEILMFVANKVDKMDCKLGKMEGKFGFVRASLKYHWIALTVVAGGVIFLFKSIFIGG